MLVLNSSSLGVKLYRNNDYDYCIKSISGIRRVNNIDENAEKLFMFINKHKNLIIHVCDVKYFSPTFFKKQSIIWEDITSLDSLSELLILNKEEYYVLDDYIFHSDNKCTFNIYKLSSYLKIDKIKTDLRKLIIEEILNNL